MAVNRVTFAMVAIALVFLIMPNAPATAQSRTLVVDWSGGDSPRRIGAGEPEEPPTMTTVNTQTSWSKSFTSLPPSRTVDLHILYDQDPVILPIRFLPRQSTKRLRAEAQPIDCFVQSAANQNTRLTNNFSNKPTILSVILTATVAIDTYCRPSDRAAKRAFRNLLARALRRYLTLDKSLDLTHFGPKIAAVAPQLANSLRPSQREFVLAAIETVNGLLSDETTLEEKRLAIGELLELNKSDEFAGLVKTETYLPILLNIEYQETVELAASTDFGEASQVQSLWSRIERLEAVANAPDGTEEFEMFKASGISGANISWLNSSARLLTREAILTDRLEADDSMRQIIVATDNGIDHIPGSILGNELPDWAVDPNAGLANIEQGAMMAAANTGSAPQNCC